MTPPARDNFRILNTALLLAALAATGCASTRNTDTIRTGIEQLLISNAVDQAMAHVDFTPLQERSVFVEEKYFDGVDKNYVLASVRHGILNGGGRLVPKPEEADIILEVRSGGVGTDRVDQFFGTPQFSVPWTTPITLPEVKIISRTTQIGTAKIALVAYDARSRRQLGRGGVSLARSNDQKWYVLGAGPFNSGTIREEVTTSTGQTPYPLPLIESMSWKPKAARDPSRDVVFEVPPPVWQPGPLEICEPGHSLPFGGSLAPAAN